MSLWLAMRDAIDIVTPYEDIIMDGVPAPDGTFTNVAATAVVSAMQGSAKRSRSNNSTKVHSASRDSGEASGEGHVESGISAALLIASSTIPNGLATDFTVTVPGASASWLLCDVATGKSVAVSADGVAHWQAETEHGSVLLMAASTPCHK